MKPGIVAGIVVVLLAVLVTLASPAGAQDPAANVRDAQQVLRDRGYYQGPLDGVLSLELRRAIWQFQFDRGLLKTARLDAATIAALELSSIGAASTRPDGFEPSQAP